LIKTSIFKVGKNAPTLSKETSNNKSKEKLHKVITNLSEKRKKKDHRQWHTSNRHTSVATPIIPSTRSGRTVNIPQPFKSFRISVKQALKGDRPQESKEE
jgi:hypothetical protein